MLHAEITTFPSVKTSPRDAPLRAPLGSSCHRVKAAPTLASLVARPHGNRSWALSHPPDDDLADACCVVLFFPPKNCSNKVDEQKYNHVLWCLRFVLFFFFRWGRTRGATLFAVIILGLGNFQKSLFQHLTFRAVLPVGWFFQNNVFFVSARRIDISRDGFQLKSWFCLLSERVSVFFLGTLPTKCANIASATLPKWATFCLARLESLVRTFEVLLVCPSLEILLTDPTRPVWSAGATWITLGGNFKERRKINFLYPPLTAHFQEPFPGTSRPDRFEKPRH